MATYPGLSYTGEANAPSAADDDNTQNIGALAQTAKNKNKVPLGSAETADMLENMQAILNERSSPMNTFLGGLQRASAWGSGGAQGPAAALTEMDRQKLAEQQNTLAMQQSMASMRSEQAARQRFQQSQGFGQPTGQTQAQPGMQMPSYQDTIMKLPSSMRADALNALREGDRETWKSYVLAAERNRTPASRDIEQVEEMERQNHPYADIYKGQTFKEGIAPRVQIIGGKEFKHSPNIPGMLSNASMPTTGGGVDAEAWAKANGIVLSRNGGNRTFEGQLDQFIQNPNLAAAPGTSPHEGKRALDIPVQYRNDPAVKAKLEAAGFRATRPNEPWHYELPKGATLPGAAPAIGAPGTSVQDIESKQRAFDKSYQTFMDNDYKVITERANEAKKIEQLSDQVLANIEGNNFGPGSKLKQSFMEYAQLAGIKLSDKEMQKFVDNQGIETARKFLSAAGARQAMGAQFTQQESADWFKAFAGINDQKQYLKNFYQMQRAGALVDQDLKNYLALNKGREDDAINKWKASGVKDRIMQANVDAFKNGKPGKVEVSGAKPAAQKTIQKTGMVTDKNNPNYGKKVILYNDGSMDFQ